MFKNNNKKVTRSSLTRSRLKKSLPKLKIKKVNFTLLLILFVFFGTLIFFGIKVFEWRRDSSDLKEEISHIYNMVSTESLVSDNRFLEIVPPTAELKEDDPYWDYIEMDLMDVDFSSLKEINNETVAWIKVNGTNINYPVVKHSDNSYYLKRSFFKKYNDAGWVFMDYRNHISTFDKNTIIYAHGRVDTTMFGSLKNLLSSNWYQNSNNHVINLVTESSSSLWQVFSVYHIPTTSDYLYTEFINDEKFLVFLNRLKSRSVYDFPVTFSESDKVITLSTCYNEEEKMVMHAKLIKILEK